MKDYTWYHIIELNDGTKTDGIARYVPQQNLTIAAMQKVDFKNKRVLDIGCRDGLLSFKADFLGAKEIIAIDNVPSKGLTELLIPHFKSKVQAKEFSVYDLHSGVFGLFDIVIFSGVLYHLRFPFKAIDAIRSVMVEGGIMILETAVIRGLTSKPIVYCPTEEDSPYEPTSITFFNKKGLEHTLPTLRFSIIDSTYLTKNIFIKKNYWLNGFYIDRCVFTCTATGQPGNTVVWANV